MNTGFGLSVGKSTQLESMIIKDHFGVVQGCRPVGNRMASLTSLSPHAGPALRGAAVPCLCE